MVKIEIDKGSGFCFGVVNAIKKAEEELEKVKFFTVLEILFIITMKSNVLELKD